MPLFTEQPGSLWPCPFRFSGKYDDEQMSMGPEMKILGLLWNEAGIPNL